MKIKMVAVIAIALFLEACASVLVRHDHQSSETLNESQYSQDASSKGVVLLAANWNRSWNCGGFENAELRSIGFDRLAKRPPKDAPLILSLTVLPVSRDL